ncbi:MAG: InlB B-repeat-containing protein [Candidatus Saliniplasma sp.]
MKKKILSILLVGLIAASVLPGLVKSEDLHDLTINIDGGGSELNFGEGTHQVITDTYSLEASADPGWEFVEWTGAVSSTNKEISVEVTSDKTVTAVFKEKLSLTIKTDGEGSESNYGTGTWTVLEDETVSLEASADPGWEFVEWRGNKYSTDPDFSFTMQSDTTVTAEFSQTADPIHTQWASGVTPYNATLEGELVDMLGSDESNVMFQYRKKYYSYNTTWTSDTVTLSEPQSFSITVSDFQPGTTYYYRAVAEIDGTKYYGSEETFTTETVPPEIDTVSYSGLDTTSVDATGEITYDGGHDSLDVYFSYRQVGMSEWNETQESEVSGETEFSQTLSGLQEGTDYEFRAAVDYEDGATLETKYGDTFTFTTLPDVVTDYAENIQMDRADIVLQLYNQDRDVAVYFQYKRSIDTSWTSTPDLGENQTGEYTQTVTGLDENTKYDYRAVLEYGSNTTHGDTLMFETKSEDDTYTLTVKSEEGGSIEEPGKGVFQYLPGQEVDLIVQPDDNHTFYRWSGDNGNITDPYSTQTTIIMNDNYTITAQFNEDDTAAPPSSDEEDDGWSLGGILPDIPIHYIILILLGIAGFVFWRRYSE